MHHLLVAFLLGAPVFSAPPTVDLTIAASKTTHPETFARVSGVFARASELDAHKRGPFAAMTPLFRAAGPDAAPALVEPLVHPERFAWPAEESAKIALRAGLIEAAGALGDPANAPVWRALLASSTEPHEVRAAAEALGRVASEADAATLVALVKTKGPKQEAVIGGVSSLRRADVAIAIGDAAVADVALAEVAARSLARLGSSWTTDAAKLVAVRDEAAKQAIRIFVLASGAARAAASDAVMSVDAPGTAAAITAARVRATPEQNTALGELAARFAKNPVRP